MVRPFATLGALFAGLGVLAGAFGAHALRGTVEDSLLEAFRTGALYLLVHGLALFGLGLGGSALPRGPARMAGFAFCAGIVLFSGSLFAMTLTGNRAWGAITPLGGVGFLIGWLCATLATLRAE